MQVDMPSLVGLLKSCAAVQPQSGPTEYIRKLLGRCAIGDICFSEIDCEAFNEEDLEAFMENNVMDRLERIVDVIGGIAPAPAGRRMFF